MCQVISSLVPTLPRKREKFIGAFSALPINISRKSMMIHQTETFGFVDIYFQFDFACFLDFQSNLSVIWVKAFQIITS